VEVKIGVQQASRELVIDSGQTAAEIAAAVAKALADSAGVLTLADEKGKQIIVPVTKLAYVEIDDAVVRKVGFTAG
jgi:Protein of unknown function (DUF3107)